MLFNWRGHFPVVWRKVLLFLKIPVAIDSVWKKSDSLIRNWINDLLWQMPFYQTINRIRLSDIIDTMVRWSSNSDDYVHLSDIRSDSHRMVFSNNLIQSNKFLSKGGELLYDFTLFVYIIISIHLNHKIKSISSPSSEIRFKNISYDS